MSWSVLGCFLLVVLGLHVVLLRARPGARSVALLASATCALAVLSIVCVIAAERRDDAARTAEMTARSEMDRDFVVLLHLIDAARDMACNTQPPKSTDETLLAAYTRIRTTCAFYASIWIEASRASDLPGVLAAAEKPWPPSGSPREQLWTYGPLKAMTDRIEARRHRQGIATVTGLTSRLAGALPFVMAALIAVALSTVTAIFLYGARDSVSRPGIR